MLGWLFCILLTIAGVAAGWLNPFFGLMAYYALSSLKPRYTWFWKADDFPEQMIQYTAIATLIGWALMGFGGGKNLRYIKWPVFGLALYLAAGTVAWQLFAINSDVAWDNLSLQLKIGLMLLVALALIHGENRVKIFAWVIAGSLCYLGWAFNDWYRQDPLYLWRHGWGGVDNNGVAMIMVMGVPLAFFLAIYDKRWWVKGLLFLGTACMIHVVLFSFSRGGQLGLCMVGATLFIFALVALPRKILTVSLAIVFVFLALRLAGPEVRARFMTIFNDPAERDASAASRFDTWKGGFNCMMEHPLGVGPRNFNLISHQYGLPPNKSIHNLFLQTGADYGIAGMIGLFIFYAATFLQCFFTSLHPVARRLVWPRYYCQMVCVSIAGFLICSIFIGMESVEAGYMIAIVGMLTVAHVKHIAAVEKEVDPDHLPERAPENTPGSDLPPLPLAKAPSVG